MDVLHSGFRRGDGETGLQDPSLARPLVEMPVTSWERDVTKACETHLSDCVYVSPAEMPLEATRRPPSRRRSLVSLPAARCSRGAAAQAARECTVRSYSQVLAKFFRNLRQSCGGI